MLRMHATTSAYNIRLIHVCVHVYVYVCERVYMCTVCMYVFFYVKDIPAQHIT